MFNFKFSPNQLRDFKYYIGAITPYRGAQYDPYPAGDLKNMLEVHIESMAELIEHPNASSDVYASAILSINDKVLVFECALSYLDLMYLSEMWRLFKIVEQDIYSGSYFGYSLENPKKTSVEFELLD